MSLPSDRAMVPQDTWLLRLRAHVVRPAAVNKAVQQHMHQWSDSTRRYLQAVGVHTASQDVPDRRVHAVPHVPLSKTTPKARLFRQWTGFVVDLYVRRVAVHAPLCHQSMIKPQYNTKQGTKQGTACCCDMGAWESQLVLFWVFVPPRAAFHPHGESAD